MKGRKFTIYAVTTSILWETCLAAVVLWLLPLLGIQIPIWALILLMIALGAYEYFTYRLEKKALDKKPLISPDIGSKGRVTTPLTPRGYIRVDAEKWLASAIDSNIEAGEEVVVVGMEGTTLFVTCADKDNQQTEPK
jgi:membrane protein implicated in regulation of membrane protease activity